MDSMTRLPYVTGDEMFIQFLSTSRVGANVLLFLFNRGRLALAFGGISPRWLFSPPQKVYSPAFWRGF